MTDAERLRELIAQTGLGQRELARVLEISEREFRRMCAGKRLVPLAVMLAMQRLIEVGVKS